MPRVVVFTESGQPVWQMPDLEPWHLTGLKCEGNVKGSALASGIRRAVHDAEIIEAGGNPERASEEAMRLANDSD